MNYPEAIRHLGGLYGVEIPETGYSGDNIQKEEKNRVKDILKEAAKYYYKSFNDEYIGKPARDYAAKRGLSKQTLDNFGLGYSPINGGLYEFLKQKGYIPTIKAFCWMQGEGDSYVGYYDVYQDNLRKFVGNVRTDLKALAGDKDMPFIDAGISNAKPWRPYYKNVNEAKVAFAEESENNYFIDTIAAGLHTNEEPFDTPDEVREYRHRCSCGKCGI